MSLRRLRYRPNIRLPRHQIEEVEHLLQVLPSAPDEELVLQPGELQIDMLRADLLQLARELILLTTLSSAPCITSTGTPFSRSAGAFGPTPPPAIGAIPAHRVLCLAPRKNVPNPPIEWPIR
jgi:hypothetical protein